jgi:hypothetical protein
MGNGGSSLRKYCLIKFRTMDNIHKKYVTSALITNHHHKLSDLIFFLCTSFSLSTLPSNKLIPSLRMIHQVSDSCK